VGGMIERLRQLVQRYITGEIDYANFRNNFVRFLAASDNDALVERLYDVIESACSAFDHNYLNEIALKGQLAHAAWPPSMNAPRSSENAVVDFVFSSVRFVGSPIPSFTSNSIAAASSAAPSNRQDSVIVEPGLIPA
jgi:hypothetical protein